MKPDLKIGIIVGVLVVVVLMIFFASRNTPQRPNADLGPIALEQSDQIDLAPFELDEVPVLFPLKSPAPVIDPLKTEVEPVVNVIIQSEASEAGELQPAVAAEASVPVFNEPPPVPKPVPVVDEKKPPRYYMVQEGDTLSEISLGYYSSASYWKELQKANSHLIKNVNQLKVGWKLRIPHASDLADKNR